LDSDEIRNALCQRIIDPSRDVREESLVSLAKRMEQRALPALVAELDQPEISDRMIEAAESFLGESEDRHDWSPRDYVAALKMRFSM
jgi:hypothetical protein